MRNFCADVCEKSSGRAHGMRVVTIAIHHFKVNENAQLVAQVIKLVLQTNAKNTLHQVQPVHNIRDVDLQKEITFM